MTTEYPGAGRELDRMIGERLMGFEIGEVEPGRWVVFSHGQQVSGRCHTERGALDYIPRYSTSMAAAWLVVEECYRRWPRQITITLRPSRADGIDICGVVIHAAERPAEGVMEAASEPLNAAPLAICIAALRALDATTAERAQTGPLSSDGEAGPGGTDQGGAVDRSTSAGNATAL